MLGHNFNFITGKSLKVNLDQLHGFYLLSNFFLLFQLQKTLYKAIFFLKLDPDPQKMKANPLPGMYCTGTGYPICLLGKNNSENNFLS